MLAPDVVIISDSGGQAQAPRRPVYGQDKVARLLVGFAGRVPEGLTFGLEYFNGSLGIVARIDGRPFAAMAVTVAEGTVQSLQLIVNPGEVGVPARGQPSAVTTQMPARPVLPGWASASTWVPAAERIVTPAVVGVDGGRVRPAARGRVGQRHLVGSSSHGWAPPSTAVCRLATCAAVAAGQGRATGGAGGGVTAGAQPTSAAARGRKRPRPGPACAPGHRRAAATGPGVPRAPHVRVESTRPTGGGPNGVAITNLWPEQRGDVR